MSKTINDRSVSPIDHAENISLSTIDHKNIWIIKTSIASIVDRP